MAFEITNDCINCGACLDCCPAGAIKQGETKYEIDKNACIDCGLCVGECPPGAIVEK